MSRTRRLLVFAALLIPTAATGADSPKETAKDAPKQKRPALEVRVSPRFGFSPVLAHLTAELKGGDEIEEYYCPEIEWEWDDGGKSVQEPDCPPFEAGKTPMERRYTAEHEYRRAGSYTIRFAMRRGNRTLAQGSVRLTVKPGLGDRTQEPGE